ncbi:hypothetical protein ZHAS_00018494 [Anopheles sinensis]|uniref:Uncharacterized protein n=1 Tax=Anopheles sinensis TaxID=74873 RepID=A0A084WJR8_ANOSI|nr:hypothetical protein ZHAS_00018494 [Anopheles sinensis]
MADTLEKLDFDRNNIKKLSSYLFVNATNLTSILFRSNQLRDVGDFTFPGLINKENLQLGHNHIRNLPRKLFAGLKSLSSLGIFQNRLEELEDDLFQDLIELKELDLSYNKIETLSNIEFAGIPQLQELDLRDNRIANIGNGTFSLPELTKLYRELYLPGNKLKTIGGVVFCGNHELRILSLQLNKLIYVAPEALNCLEITDLDLSKNHLQSLLISVSTLEKLDLSSNRLRNLSDDAFSNLTNLDALTMDNNYLEAIPKTVSALPTLVWLSLKNNKINSTSVESGLQSIESLELTKNLITSVELDQHHTYPHQNYIEDFPEKVIANIKYLQTLLSRKSAPPSLLENRFKHNEGLDDLRLYLEDNRVDI